MDINEPQMIDPANWVRRKIQLNANVAVELEGLTARAVRKLLEGVDPDSLVVFNRQPADGSIFLTAIAGQYNPSDCDVVYLLDSDTCATMHKRLQELREQNNG